MSKLARRDWFRAVAAAAIGATAAPALPVRGECVSHYTKMWIVIPRIHPICTPIYLDRTRGKSEVDPAVIRYFRLDNRPRP